MNRFSNGLGCHMPCKSLDGFRKTGTHSRARDSCQVLTFSGIWVWGVGEWWVCVIWVFTWVKNVRELGLSGGLVRLRQWWVTGLDRV